MQLQVELIAPDGKLAAEGLQPLQVVAQAAVPLRSGGFVVAPQIQLLQHFAGGSATVVPDPRQPESCGISRGLLPRQPVALHGQWIPVGADGGGHQGQHLSATATAPAEQPVGEGGGGVPGQLVGAEPAHARGRRHRRQAGAEAETVGKPGQLMLPLREGPAAVGLSFLKLPQEGGGADQHAIGFHPGAVERLPAAGAHRGADPREQGGTMPLQPGIQRRGGMAEVQVGVVVDQIEG